jgi:hypothetical protein
MKEPRAYLRWQAGPPKLLRVGTPNPSSLVNRPSDSGKLLQGLRLLHSKCNSEVRRIGN